MSSFARLAAALACGALLSGVVRPLAAQAPAPASTTPAVSGTLRGNYHYLLGGPRKDFNQFTVERAYLTVRGTPAPNTDYRVTADVFQSGDGNGWAMRLKYAYFGYTFAKAQPWETALRAGILQTVTIEQQEVYWPRWLGPVAIDRHGFFQSADAGVAVHTQLPRRLGEVYAHVVNGSGYFRRETDRFKDLGARLTLTPLSASANPLLASLAISGWLYDGAVASQFVADSTRPVGSGLARDRWGVHAAVRDPRITLAADYSRRADDLESGGNTVLAPRVVTSRDGAVASGFAIVRPAAFWNDEGRSPFALVARYDDVQPVRGGAGDYHYLLAGAIYEINRRFALSLNYQEQLGGAAPSPLRGAYANFVVDF